MVLPAGEISIELREEKTKSGGRRVSIWEARWVSSDGTNTQVRASTSLSRSACLERLKAAVVMHYYSGTKLPSRAQFVIDWSQVQASEKTWTIKSPAKTKIPSGKFKTKRIIRNLKTGSSQPVWVTTWEPLEKSRKLTYWARDPKFTTESSISAEVSRGNCEAKVREFWVSPETSKFSETKIRFGSRGLSWKKPKRIPIEYGRDTQVLLIPKGLTQVTQTIHAKLVPGRSPLRSEETWTATWHPTNSEPIGSSSSEEFESLFRVVGTSSIVLSQLRKNVVDFYRSKSRYPKGKFKLDLSENPWGDLRKTLISEMVDGVSWSDIRVRRQLIKTIDRHGLEEIEYEWVAIWQHSENVRMTTPQNLSGQVFECKDRFSREAAIEGCYQKIRLFG